VIRSSWLTLTRSIRGRLLLAALLVEAVMLTLLVSNSLRLQRENLIDQAQLHVRQIGPVLNAALVAPMAQRDYATLQAVLDESRSSQGIVYLILNDNRGKIVAISGWKRDQPPPPLDERFDLDKEDDPPRYDVSTPIVLAGQELGLLRYGLDMSHMAVANRELLLQGAAIASGELLLSVALLTALGLWLTRKLVTLTRATNAVAHGSQTFEPVAEGDDEVGQLGRAFNAMSRAIRDRIGELEALHTKEQAQVRAAAEANSRLMALLEAMDIGVLLADGNGRVLFANAELARIWGLDDGAALVGSDLPAIERLCRMRLPATGIRSVFGADQTCHEIVLADQRTVTQRSFPVRDESAREIGRLWLSEDITRAREVADELRSAKEAAEAASRATAAFLATMSHEIRTPMNGIIGMTDMALGGALDDEQREYLNWVKSSADSLMVILNDILDYSKVAAGHMEIESVDFDLGQLMDDALAMFAAQARKKGILLERRLQPGLPERVVGDPVRLRQVVSNLLSNAVKFTRSGGVSLTVEPLGDDGTGPRIAFVVTDTGIGIAPDKQGRVFAPFSQADSSTTRNYGGTGLGLAIVARLVELMGGRISLHSVPGEGSSFRVELPLRDAAGERRHPGASAGRLPQACAERFDADVLVAEDTAVNQVLLQSLLTKHGVKVTLVSDGQQAVAACQAHLYDLILMDLQMPVMDGLDAVRLIRALPAPHWQQISIIAITANAMEDDRRRCREAGMDDFISKPFHTAQLLRVLRQHLPVSEVR
jgi:signal transduction histidine kinase/ActR/RegA family two-component response regulator